MINTGTVKILDKLVCIGALAPFVDRFAALCAGEGYSPRIVRDKSHSWPISVIGSSGARSR